MQTKQQPRAGFPKGTDNAAVDGLMALQQRNLAAFAAAAQVFGEGTRAILGRQNEMAATMIGRLTQQPFSFDRPEEMMSRQAEIAQANIETTLDSMKAMGEIARDCCQRAFELVQQQVVATLDAGGSLGAQVATPMAERPKANAA